MSLRIERLNNWANSLSENVAKSLLAILVDELIDSETIHFYDNSPAPYWDGNGEYLDGKDYDNE